jgi:hypothetical protein
MTMSQYFTKMKGFTDELAASGMILDDEEIVSYILNGMDSDYTPMVSSWRTGEDDQRSSEWESIKILLRNLVYIEFNSIPLSSNSVKIV